jgi:hypothetical protein
MAKNCRQGAFRCYSQTILHSLTANERMDEWGNSPRVEFITMRGLDGFMPTQLLLQWFYSINKVSDCTYPIQFRV